MTYKCLNSLIFFTTIKALKATYMVLMFTRSYNGKACKPSPGGKEIFTRKKISNIVQLDAMAGLRGYHSVLVSIFVFIVLTLILCSKNVKLFVKKQRAVGVLSAPRREGRGNGSRIDIHLVSTIYISPPPQTSDTAATAQYQQRRKEHITCLHRNLKHPLVRKYYLFTDKDDAKIKGLPPTWPSPRES